MRSSNTFHQQINRTIVYMVLIAWSILSIGPLFWMFYSSFKSNSQIVANVWALPHPWILSNWVQVLSAAVNSVPFAMNIANTLLVAIPATIVVVICGSLAGYALARFRFRGAQLLQIFFLVLLPVPQFAVMIPVWSYMNVLGLTNSRVGLFFVYCAFNLALAITLMRGFLSSFPSEIIEASQLDGCSELGAYFRIALPLSLGPMTIVGILTFGGLWNEFLFAMSLIQDPSRMTVQPALAAFSAGQISFGWATEFSALAIATVIPIAIFLAFQKQIFQAVTLPNL